MDVREKLVELIFDSLCRHIDKSCKLAENIADDLISNGVTVQEGARPLEEWNEDYGDVRGCSSNSVQKGCVSMTNSQKIRAMSDEEREYINGTHKAYRIKEGGR